MMRGRLRFQSNLQTLLTYNMHAEESKTIVDLIYE